MVVYYTNSIDLIDRTCCSIGESVISKNFLKAEGRTLWDPCQVRISPVDVMNAKTVSIRKTCVEMQMYTFKSFLFMPTCILQTIPYCP